MANLPVHLPEPTDPADEARTAWDESREVVTALIGGVVRRTLDSGNPVDPARAREMLAHVDRLIAALERLRANLRFLSEHRE